MSEIERAIETIEGYIKAVEQRMQSGDCGVVVGYHAMLERQAGLKTALTLCRAELEREKNPLTCEGCASESLKDWCRLCVRCGKPRPDYYVRKKDSEPKGEKA